MVDKTAATVMLPCHGPMEGMNSSEFWHIPISQANKAVLVPSTISAISSTSTQYNQDITNKVSVECLLTVLFPWMGIEQSKLQLMDDGLTTSH